MSGQLAFLIDVLGLLFRFWEHTKMTRASRLGPRFLVVIATSAAITMTIIGCGNDDGLGRRFPSLAR